MLKITVDDNFDTQYILFLGKEHGKKAVKETAEKIYAETQSRCPVRSGTLKNSGYITELDEGYEVGYTASYADYVDKIPAQWVKNGSPRFFSEVVENYSRGGQNV